MTFIIFIRYFSYGFTLTVLSMKGSTCLLVLSHVNYISLTDIKHSSKYPTNILLLSADNSKNRSGDRRFQRTPEVLPTTCHDHPSSDPNTKSSLKQSSS